MNYELHITVKPLRPSFFTEFDKWCRSISAKPLLIHVPGAAQAVQPMIAVKAEFSSNHAVKLWEEMWHAVALEWDEVTRVKLESSVMQSHGLYTECHWKIPAELSREDIFKYSEEVSGLLLSRNAITKIWYLTWRSNSITSHPLESYASLSRFSHHHECVLKDSNFCLDRGWLSL